MKKSALINALSVVPENADLCIEFTTSDYYNSTYKGYVTGISMKITDSEILDASVLVSQFPDNGESTNQSGTSTAVHVPF